MDFWWHYASCTTVPFQPMVTGGHFFFQYHIFFGLVERKKLPHVSEVSSALLSPMKIGLQCSDSECALLAEGSSFQLIGIQDLLYG